jgi:prepilin-type N-terminal cleavage/methylation domain-containing protein
MLNTLRQRSTDESAFTLIELLVVITIIGLLAALAIPIFLNQKGKASDAGAKELARTAQTTAEAIATDNNGSYANVTTKELNALEESIPIAASETSAYLSAAKEIEAGKGFEVTATAGASKDTFTIKHTGAAVITRSCETPTKKAAGGCPESKEW